MSRADNLTKKGADANPNGRPKKGYSITEMMKEMLNNSPERKAEIGEVIYAKAKEGDVTAIKTLWQYMDGMPKQDINTKVEFPSEVDYIESKNEDQTS